MTLHFLPPFSIARRIPRRKKKKPNKAPEPTPCFVTPRAFVPEMKSPNRNVFPNAARIIPAQGVPHL
jgi:hypothetical protein